MRPLSLLPSLLRCINHSAHNCSRVEVLHRDCLTLNVVRPSGTTADDKLPVGLWIYGGGFQQGGTADPRYNSSWIIQRSVEMEKPIVRSQPSLVQLRIAARPAI